MGSPRSPGGRVLGNFRYKGSLNDGRLGPLTVREGHRNSYNNRNPNPSPNPNPFCPILRIAVACRDHEIVGDNPGYPFL